MVNDLKSELVSYIQNTEDEALLHLLKEECIFYDKQKTADITDDLNDEQLKELTALAEEPGTKDIDTLEDFKNATAQWRMK